MEDTLEARERDAYISARTEDTAKRSIGVARHCAEAVIFVHAMKAYGREEVQLCQLLTSALYGCVWQISFRARF